MGKDTFEWVLDGPPPLIHSHGRIKHDVYLKYLRDYVFALIQNPRRRQLRLTVVDGFCGGGVYRDAQSNAEVSGSPILLAEELVRLEEEVQQARTSPFNFDWELHLSDADPIAIVLLHQVLKDRNLGALIGQKIHIHSGKFEAVFPKLMAHLRVRKGRSIFILDQYGYTAVPFRVLREIFSALRKPEVILTFAYGHIRAFITDLDRLNNFLEANGIQPIERDVFDVASLVQNGTNYLIQKVLREAFLRIAEYITPFFITSRSAGAKQGSNLEYWMVHMADHATANDVMKNTHWNLQNSFGHFGGPGLNMLGYDPYKMDKNIAGHMFGDLDKLDTLDALMSQIPNALEGLESGISARDFFGATCNDTPSNSAIQRDAISKLAAEKDVELFTHKGSRKRSLVVNPTDRLVLPAQRKFIL